MEETIHYVCSTAFGICCTGLEPLLRSDIAKLEGVQRRATKVAQGMRGKKYEKRLRLLDLTTLEERRVRGDLIQWFKIKEGFEDVNFIRKPCLGHPRAGVRSQYILETVKNCQQREKFFIVRAPDVWNKLPDTVVGASSVVSFKIMLDAYCRMANFTGSVDFIAAYLLLLLLSF